MWATGFRDDFGWVEPAPLGEDGYPVTERGVVPAVPGLYFVGLPFQYAFSSAMVHGVGRDAEHVARHLARLVAPRRVATSDRRVAGRQPAQRGCGLVGRGPCCGAQRARRPGPAASTPRDDEASTWRRAGAEHARELPRAGALRAHAGRQERPVDGGEVDAGALGGVADRRADHEPDRAERARVGVQARPRGPP